MLIAMIDTVDVLVLQLSISFSLQIVIKVIQATPGYITARLLCFDTMRYMKGINTV